MKKIITFFILFLLIFPGSAFSKSKTLYWKSLLTEENGKGQRDNSSH